MRVLVVHHPDGGFHRFELLKDGGIAAADGAEQAQLSPEGAVSEVTLGNNRYRFTAAQLGHAAQP